MYDSYGKKCQHRFLLNYGFAVENNVEEDGKCPNEIFFKLKLLPKEVDPTSQHNRPQHNTPDHTTTRRNTNTAD